MSHLDQEGLEPGEGTDSGKAEPSSQANRREGAGSVGITLGWDLIRGTGWEWRNDERLKYILLGCQEIKTTLATSRNRTS